MRRTITREVEIGGRALPKDASLSLMWMAANRDPRAFADPDTIKLERNTTASMVWGQHCQSRAGRSCTAA